MKHSYLGVCHKKDGRVMIGTWKKTHREASAQARSFQDNPFEAVELHFAKGMAEKRRIMSEIKLNCRINQRELVRGV